MKVGIDARFLTHPQKGGFKTYTENLISALARVDEKNEYILYLDRLPDKKTRIPEQPNFSTRVLRQLPVIGMPWREQVGLSMQTARDGIDLLHSPCLTAPLICACTLVVTVHDMIWFFPQQYSQYRNFSLQWQLMERYQRFIPRFTSRRASAIITVSQVSKEAIVEQLGINPDLVHVTYEAANSFFQPMTDTGSMKSLRTKHGLETRFILAIGSADPRKNIETLVSSYALLPENMRREYQLVIVWTAPVLAATMSRHVRSLGLDGNVKFLYQVSNEELVLLYNEASLFVFPSLYEGFGLPMLEAMACGVPVVASNSSSIPEVAGDAALLVDARDPNGISKAMVQVLSDDELASEMIQKGLQRNAMFFWEKCARETLMVYSQALSEKQTSHQSHDYRSAG